MTPENSHSFIDDANALHLPSPVTTIAKATGEKNITVSKYLRGKKKPDMTFLLKFYHAFTGDLAKIGRFKIVGFFIAPKNLEGELAALQQRLQAALTVGNKIPQITTVLNDGNDHVYLYENKEGNQQPSNN